MITTPDHLAVLKYQSRKLYAHALRLQRRRPAAHLALISALQVELYSLPQRADKFQSEVSIACASGSYVSQRQPPSTHTLFN